MGLKKATKRGVITPRSLVPPFGFKNTNGKCAAIDPLTKSKERSLDELEERIVGGPLSEGLLSLWRRNIFALSRKYLATRLFCCVPAVSLEVILLSIVFRTSRPTSEVLGPSVPSLALLFRAPDLAIAGSTAFLSLIARCSVVLWSLQDVLLNSGSALARADPEFSRPWHRSQRRALTFHPSTQPPNTLSVTLLRHRVPFHACRIFCPTSARSGASS